MCIRIASAWSRVRFPLGAMARLTAGAPFEPGRTGPLGKGPNRDFASQARWRRLA